jgi:hypothetical protein
MDLPPAVVPQVSSNGGTLWSFVGLAWDVKGGSNDATRMAYLPKLQYAAAHPD